MRLSASRRLQEIEGPDEDVVAAFLRLRSDAAVARELGLQVRQVRRLIDVSVPEARVLRRARRTASQAYADQDLLCALREAARELPSPLAIESYRRWAQAKSNGHPCPGPEVIILRFAGWRRALVRAGLPSNARHGPHAAYDYTTVVGAIAAAWREMGGYPSVVRYDAWRAGRSQIPSAATVRRFARSWDDLLADAYPLVYGIGGEQVRRRVSRDGALEAVAEQCKWWQELQRWHQQMHGPTSPETPTLPLSPQAETPPNAPMPPDAPTQDSA